MDGLNKERSTETTCLCVLPGLVPVRLHLLQEVGEAQLLQRRHHVLRRHRLLALPLRRLGAKTGRTSGVKHLLEDFVNRAAGGRCPPSTAPQRGICSKRPLAPTQCFGIELIRSLTPQAAMLATLRRGERTHETLRCARAKIAELLTPAARAS